MACKELLWDFDCCAWSRGGEDFINLVTALCIDMDYLEAGVYDLAGELRRLARASGLPMYLYQRGMSEAVRPLLEAPAAKFEAKGLSVPPPSKRTVVNMAAAVASWIWVQG